MPEGFLSERWQNVETNETAVDCGVSSEGHMNNHEQKSHHHQLHIKWSMDECISNVLQQRFRAWVDDQQLIRLITIKSNTHTL